MKKIVFIIPFILIIYSGVKAQHNKQLSFQLSSNQAELSLQYNPINRNSWLETYFGIGNHDINAGFNDFLSGLRIGYNVLSNDKNAFGPYVKGGIYIPNSDYYEMIIPVIGAGARYIRYLGKSGRHCMLIGAGYQYGQRIYKQNYSSEILESTTIEKFTLKPLFFSLGYGIKI